MSGALAGGETGHLKQVIDQSLCIRVRLQMRSVNARHDLQQLGSRNGLQHCCQRRLTRFPNLRRCDSMRCGWVDGLVGTHNGS
jgi:hypothetical protein